MAIVSSVYVEILWSFVALIYGIRVERYFVSYWSAIVNLAGFLLVLVTVDLVVQGYALLGVYVLLCFAVVYYNQRGLFALLGSKTYGSLTLAIGLQSLDVLKELGRWGATILNPWFGTDTGTMILAWAIFAFVSHILCAVLTPREFQ